MRNKKLKSEKGVSLIIVFFVMLILVAIILSASTLLFIEIKMVKNIGLSVASFYAADSGIEKVLYYDRRVVPEGAVRGICNICNADTDLVSCSATGLDCALSGEKCTDCHIDFTTSMIDQKKSYNVIADVLLTSGADCGISQGDVESYGNNENIKRAIKLDISKNVGIVLGPSIDPSGTTFTVKPNDTVSVYIEAIIADTSVSSVTAYLYVKDQSGTFVPYIPNPEITLVSGANGVWHKNLGTLPEGIYQVSIGAVSGNGICASVTVTQ